MSIFKINQSYLEKQTKTKRVEELKALLKESDFKILPDYDKKDESLILQRQQWREEIRLLEIDLSNL